MILANVIRYSNAAAVEVTWVDEEGTPLRCQVFSQEQMEELRDALGSSAAEYENMIAEIEQLPLPEESIVVPDVCSPAQGLIALYAAKGIAEADLSVMIEQIADPTVRYTTQIAFFRATEWRRHSPALAGLGQLLGLTEADLDELFTHAVTVQV